MFNEKTQKLAERIALLLQENEGGSDDFSFVRASLEKINERLDKIEDRLGSQNSNNSHASSFVFQPSLPHPSHERFSSLEEASDVIINSLQNEKACAFEPNGKPCDHCAMCSSRGF